MKQPKLFTWMQVILVTILPWVYLAFIWKDLPAIIPVHFELNGHPDKYGPKNNIVIVPAILSGLTLLIFLLFQGFRKYVSAEKVANASVLLSKVSVVLAYFFCGISLLILYWTLSGKVVGLQIVFAGVALLFAFIGNSMYSIKPNKFAGFRVPWTLKNEDIWRTTHQFSSKLWFFGGIILAVVSLLLSTPALFFVFFGCKLILLAIPFFYSYKLYKNYKTKGHV